MAEIRIAIVGFGNCASSLIQGIEYYKTLGDSHPDRSLGLMHYDLGGYKPSNIKIVAAFDIDQRKVGRPLKDAIFAKPNCTKVFHKNISDYPLRVMMGRVLDGISPHMKDYPDDRRFIVARKKPCDVVKALKQSGAEILISYLPVGSERATAFYADACLKTGTGYINCIPVFIASNKSWAKRFEEKKIPVIGDDIKSQIGATIIHRALTRLFEDRGVKVDATYQLNVGGNTDFLNMLNRNRVKSKKISKTEAVQSQLHTPLKIENIHIGPSDYVPWLLDNKICFLRMEGTTFGNIPINLELRLSVEDSPNSGGVVIDAIRCCKIALERGVGGVLVSPSAYFMKHPMIQFPDEEARDMVENFISGKRVR
ncbi:MAG: inositol-3-phosphate synthase [Nitrospirota bacterium]|nr:inositol-3-phosphate synthase [Nitrospirota bacterium]MDH5767910.1 inositol-3-phosphate synthase [Nitrospirota bacterium]